jgi:hypothetical protein
MKWVKYAVVLVTGFIAGSRTVEAVQSWRQWHIWSLRDPSAADAYRTTFMMNLVIAGLSLAIAALVWWLLRPAGGEPGTSSSQ